MKRVVYLLGAGFSAPLGIPVMRNFLDRARDLYFTNIEKYANFKPVFDMIRKFYGCNIYYKTDFFNIEDILSLLEMNTGLNREIDADDRAAERASFKKFIVDVIQASTPSRDTSKGGGWQMHIFGGDLLGEYGQFVAGLLRQNYTRLHEPVGNVIPDYQAGAPTVRPNEFQYSVITLNYDVVLENAVHDLELRTGVTRGFSPHVADTSNLSDYGGHLAKLHGSVDSGEIIPPTWNKQIASESIQTAWETAHWLLAHANHIRVLGYSLPQADSYVKYLLRAAVVSNDHLKSIDVLCLDPDGSVQKRYDEFICFPHYRFASADAATYLRSYRDYCRTAATDPWPKTVKLADLEAIHSGAFSPAAHGPSTP
jgi:hypothetical protein